MINYSGRISSIGVFALSGRMGEMKKFASQQMGWVAMAALVASGISSQALAVTGEVATVDGASITGQEIFDAVKLGSETQKRTFLKDAIAKRRVLDSIIDERLLASRAEKDKVDQDPEFQAALARIKRQLMIERLVAKQLANKTTAAAAKKFYEQNKSQFSMDRIAVQHILVDDYKRAVSLKAEAEKPGADFQALAEKNSKDPSAKNNRGDVGVIGRDAPFAESFKSVAFRTPVGKVSDPVKTDYGWHLIKVTQLEKGRTQTFDEVEGQVVTLLRQQLLGEYLLKLREQAKIQINDQAIEKL